MRISLRPAKPSAAAPVELEPKALDILKATSSKLATAHTLTFTAAANANAAAANAYAAANVNYTVRPDDGRASRGLCPSTGEWAGLLSVRQYLVPRSIRREWCLL